MRLSFPLHFILLALLLTLLGACEENPTGVGSDLLGPEGGDPTTVVIRAEELQTGQFDDLVGNRQRVLIGSGRLPDRTDNGASRVSATAYVDFLGSNTPEGFADGEVSSVRLQLAPSYVYGDTTDIAIELSTLTAELETSGARNDTTLEAGTPISFDAPVVLSPTDSLVTVQLPESWVQTNAATLISDDFADNFHGFRMAPAQENGHTVIGINVLGSHLEVVAGADTVRYPMGANSTGGIVTAPTFTKFERLGGDDARPATADRWIVQDGVGTTFDFELALLDSLAARTEASTFSLNQATLRFVADTTGFGTAVDVSDQPALERFLLSGIDENGESVGLAEARLGDDGRLVFSTRSTGVLFSYFNDVLRNDLEPFDRYQLTVPPSVNTVDYQLFYGLQSAPECPLGEPDACQPRLVVTTVPLDR